MVESTIQNGCISNIVCLFESTKLYLCKTKSNVSKKNREVESFTLISIVAKTCDIMVILPPFQIPFDIFVPHIPFLNSIQHTLAQPYLQSYRAPPRRVSNFDRVLSSNS